MNGTAGDALRAVAIANSRGEGASFQVGSSVQVSAEFLADLINDRRALASTRETNMRLQRDMDDLQRRADRVARNAESLMIENDKLRRGIREFESVFQEIPYAHRRSNKLPQAVRRLLDVASVAGADGAAGLPAHNPMAESEGKR